MDAVQIGSGQWETQILHLLWAGIIRVLIVRLRRVALKVVVKRLRLLATVQGFT